MSDDIWSRLEAERRELADRAARFADLGLGPHADALNVGGPVPPRLVGTPVIMDTDIGGDPDDALALVVAARTTPELALVVTSDEVDGERARFARHLLDLVGRTDVPVVAGPVLDNTAVIIVEGLVPSSVPAQHTDVRAAVDYVLTHTEGPVRWVGMGPLSNLSNLLASCPQWSERLYLTQMGGALHYRDPNRAEHNFRRDPAAARHVVATLPNIRLVTSDVTFTPEIEVTPASPIYQALTESGAPEWARLLVTHLQHWFAHHHPGSMQHDALTLSAALKLPFVRFAVNKVSLDEQGRMSLSPDGPAVLVSRSAMYPAFLRWLHRGLFDSGP